MYNMCLISLLYFTLFFNAFFTIGLFFETSSKRVFLRKSICWM